MSKIKGFFQTNEGGDAVVFPNIESKPSGYFKLIYQDALYFKNILKALNMFLDEVTFSLDSEGMSFAGMEPTHIIMFILNIPKNLFDDYILKEDTRFTLDLKGIVEKTLKNVSKNEVLEMENNDTLRFSLRHKFTRRFDVKLFNNPEKEDLPIPKINYTTRAVLMVEDLNKIFKDISEGENVPLIAENDTLTIESVSNYHKYSVPLSRNQESVLSLEIQENSKANYGFDYLEMFIKSLTPLVDIVELRYATDKPLYLCANLMGQGKLEFYQAPRIEG